LQQQFSSSSGGEFRIPQRVRFFPETVDSRVETESSTPQAIRLVGVNRFCRLLG